MNILSNNMKQTLDSFVQRDLNMIDKNKYELLPIYNPFIQYFGS